MILANHFINNSQLNAQKMNANYENSHVLLLLFLLLLLLLFVLLSLLLLLLFIINTLFEIEKNLHSSTKKLQSNLYPFKKIIKKINK